jgi:hypothetical protein
MDARSSNPSSADRTVSPPLILLFSVTGWKSFRPAFPKTTLPLIKSTVAAVAVLMLFVQPFARSEQSAM